jgi:hypothetical protein
MSNDRPFARRIAAGIGFACRWIGLLALILGPFIGLEDKVSGMSKDSATKVRAPAVSGSFYTDDPQALRAEIEGFFSAVKPVELPGRLIGIMVPHAGYIYSGRVAAHAYKLLQGKDFDTVILVGNCHRVGYAGIALDDSRAYRTPLGEVPVDQELVRAIAALHPAIDTAPYVHAFDHVIETQIPFLQMTLRDFKIVPILFGFQADQAARALVAGLPGLLRGRRWVLVASTDLAHYPAYDDARRVDKETLDAVVSLDPSKLVAQIERYKRAPLRNLETVMCSSTAVRAAMEIVRALPGSRATLLAYANSGDAPVGNRSQVVGYGAVAFTYQPAADSDGDREKGAGKAAEGKPSAGDADADSDKLSVEDQQWLLRLARMTLNRLSAPGDDELGEIPPAVREPRGAFVTLKKRGALRGCIGYMSGIKPLYRTVIENTLNAALNDHRFPPVTKDETGQLEIEISVLTPLREVPGPEYFEVGRHGIQIRKGVRSAVFLPQVAPEQGWDRETTFKYLCMKAGLPPDAWKSDTRFYVFEAQMFHE